jgi:methyltransferase-like protein 6
VSTHALVLFTEKLAELVQGAGFEVVENGYVQKETVNVKEGISAPRVFIQGRFLKPPDQIKLQ